MLQCHQRGAPTTGIRRCVFKRGDQGIALQDCVNSFFQNSAAFPMYQPHREDAGFEAFVKIIFQQFGHLPRGKCVQVKDICDR